MMSPKLLVLNTSPLDMGYVCKWMFMRELPVPTLKDLPQEAITVYSDGVPVAAGFLRKCEGNYALIDSCVTDPEQSPAIRDKSMNVLAEALVFRAKELGINNILAFSVDENTLTRSEKFGFERLPYAVISLTLGND